MVLELLGGLSAYATGAYTYNMGRFQFDAGQKQNSAHQQQNLSVAQMGLYREDLRDLFGMTMDKMSSYMVVGTLILGFAVNYIFNGSADFPKEPTFLAYTWIISIYASMAFALLSIWLAMHGGNAAHAAQIKLLLQAVRPHIASSTEIEEVSHDLSSYEKSGPLAFLQLPKLFGVRSGSDQNNEAATQATPEAAQVLAGRHGHKASIITPDAIAQAYAAREAQLIFDDRHDGRVGRSALHGAHLQLFRKQQQSYVSFEGYARVSMLIAAYELIVTSGYYWVAHFMVKFDANNLPDQNMAAGWMGILSLTYFMLYIFRLDMFVSNKDLRLLKALVFGAPVLGCLACHVWSIDARREKRGESPLLPEAVATLLAAFACAGHACVEGVICWLARPFTKAKLPSNFRSVRYIDFFGWWNESRHHHHHHSHSHEHSHEQTGLAAAPALPDRTSQQRVSQAAVRASVTTKGAKRRSVLTGQVSSPSPSEDTAQQAERLRKTISKMLSSGAASHFSSQEIAGLEDLENILEVSMACLEDGELQQSASAAAASSSQSGIEMPRRASIRRGSVQRRASMLRRSSLVTPWVQLEYTSDMGQAIPYYVNSESEEVCWEAPNQAVIDFRTIEVAVKFLEERVAALKKQERAQKEERALAPIAESSEPGPAAEGEGRTSAAAPAPAAQDDEDGSSSTSSEYSTGAAEMTIDEPTPVPTPGSTPGSGPDIGLQAMECVPQRPGSRHESASMPWRYFWHVSVSVSSMWALSVLFLLFQLTPMEVVPSAEQLLVRLLTSSSSQPLLQQQSLPREAEEIHADLVSVEWPHRFFRPSALACGGVDLLLCDRFEVHGAHFQPQLRGQVLRPRPLLTARQLPAEWRALALTAWPTPTALILESGGQAVLEQALSAGSGEMKGGASRRWTLARSLTSRLQVIAAVNRSAICGDSEEVPWALYGGTSEGAVIALCPREVLTRGMHSHLELEPVYVVADGLVNLAAGEGGATFLGIHVDEAGNIWALRQRTLDGSAELHSWAAGTGLHARWKLPRGRRWAAGLCFEEASGAVLVAADGGAGPHARPELWHLQPTTIAAPDAMVTEVSV